jgi:hypothetical protein
VWDGVRLSLMALEFRLLPWMGNVLCVLGRRVGAAIPQDLSVIHLQFGVSGT